MARQRFIHPGIWNSDQFCQLSDFARLVFIGIISTADDSGRRKASASSIKGEIFPQDSRRLPLVLKARDEIEAQGLIRVYTVDGEEFLDLPRWSKYQHPKYPSVSKIPAFREGSPNLPPILPESSPMGSGSSTGIAPTIRPK